MPVLKLWVPVYKTLGTSLLTGLLVSGLADAILGGGGGGSCISRCRERRFSHTSEDFWGVVAPPGAPPTVSTPRPRISVDPPQLVSGLKRVILIIIIG